MDTKTFIFEPTSIDVDLDFDSTFGADCEIRWTARGTLTIDGPRHINFTHRDGEYLYWDSRHAISPQQRDYIEGVFKAYEQVNLIPAIEKAASDTAKVFVKGLEVASLYTYASSSVGRNATSEGPKGCSE